MCVFFPLKISAIFLIDVSVEFDVPSTYMYNLGDKQKECNNV